MERAQSPQSDAAPVSEQAAEKPRKTGLVLTRYQGESILIGDEISVTVHSIQGRRIKLAVQCPENVSIRRGDV